MSRFIYPICVLNKPLFSVCPLPTQIKYWLLKKTKIHYIPSEYLEGTSLTLNNSGAFPPIELNIMGNSIQNGEPTPESPVPVNSVGDNGSGSIEKVNKNWYSGSDTLTAKFTYIIPSKIGKTYTLSFKGYSSSSSNPRVFLNNYSDIEHSESAVNSDVVTLKSTLDTYNLTITSTINGYLFIATALAISNYTFENIMLEERETATSYVTHQSKTYIIPTQQPMRSIGEVRDDFVKQDDVWYERHNIARVVLDGTENWNKANLAFQGVQASVTPNLKDVSLSAYSNYFIFHYYSSGITTNIANGEFGWNASKLLTLRNDNCSTVEDFKTWLSTHNTEVIYELAEPTLLPCTNEQIAVLNEITKDRLYEGQTNFFSEDDVPPYLKVKYYVAESESENNAETE